MGPRVYSRDEELGKRDDDFRPSKATPLSANLTRPWNWRRKRQFALLAGLVLLCMLYRNLPMLQFDTMELRPGAPADFDAVNFDRGDAQEAIGAPPRPSPSEEDAGYDHYYDGRIKFYNLSGSLHSIGRTLGNLPINRNVLFAASSLKSLANLLPIACAMSKRERNYVHFGFFGRNDLDLGEIMQINGVDVESEECPIYLHDARGDFSPYSTDRRAEASVKGAMRHINEYMHPQAIIMDDKSLEDEFFTRAMEFRADQMDRALIAVPAGRYEDFLWISRLDSGSLGSWFKPQIDIFIQAPPDTSGGMIRTVKGVEGADYAGMRVPGLTIELAPKTPPSATNFLRELEWPPNGGSSLSKGALSLHHRISSERMSSEQASLRFLESFFPIDPKHHHVLVLSPQAELNPLFMQYLHYSILEYKYCSYSDPTSEDLLGLALDVPTTFINGSSGFKPPHLADMGSRKYKHGGEEPAPFLYGGPSSGATLLFGDKWATLHDFLTNRLAASHTGVAKKTEKLVSETEPSWMEYMLELMRARGWLAIHPARSLATLHNDLAQMPEEFSHRKPKKDHSKGEPDTTDPSDDEPFLTASEAPVLELHNEHDVSKDAMPLHEFLPFGGELPDISHLPLLSHTGDLIGFRQSQQQRDKDAAVFRHQIGGCDSETARRSRRIREMSSDDLFCLPGLALEFEPSNGDDTANAVAEGLDGHIEEGA